MKKYFFLAAMLLVGAMGFVACSDDNNEKEGEEDEVQSALVCVEQIIDGCMDIANEVGNAKIGDPYDLYHHGQVEQALYAVESWYSWHSIDDYTNNIHSIRNAYYGTRDGKVASSSLATLISGANATLDQDVRNSIQRAIDAIQAIPAPFRNNIGAPEVSTAMEVCNELEEVLGNLKGYIQRNEAVNADAVLQPILNNYVNNVVLPTYSDLLKANTSLYQAAQAFQKNPSNAAFEACCEAWFSARAPWETSEAFLFGPVDALGLDPNMDSWPLDQEAIANILNSGKFDQLTWSDGDSDDDIEAVQSVRGFHTMEFLIFKDGKARTLNDGNSTDFADLDYTSSNATSWGNYMVQVGYLLQKDAQELYDSWTKSYEGGKAYKDLFLSHEIETGDDEE
ncbi:MAG: peptidase M75 [Bacteroidaceae bacterium]|nr:peptidase M75 [Bacteroidaceae bacterium]MBQ8937555.1 peptidase M75 [Bacteroidaceae bacterium]MBR0243278.1 peptidase M75 [Bacteroidaceae bacterium]